MTIERQHVGKRLSGLVIHRAPAPPISPARSPRTRRRTSAARRGRCSRSIDALLAEAGSDKTKILSATIYLADIGDFAAMNAVWEQWVVPGQTPARATVEAKLAAPEYRVEIQVVAATSGPRPDRRDVRRLTPPPRPSSPPRRGATSRAVARHAATMPVTREMFDQWHGPVLRAGAVHPRARRGLARLGPGGADVHRLRERRRRHRARPLSSGARRTR